ncbi:MAG: cytochrome c [Chitinophagales bacterium]|nr:cytochrome c [Chitinophagales bacterium]MCZ2394515.1 cytochrome c [Chitinophagales bacterium]
MIRTQTILSIFLSGALLASCSAGGDNPGYEYAPEMVHSIAYEAQSENPIYASGYTNQLPVEGAIAVGKYTYPLTNTPEGYADAATKIQNPFQFTPKEISGEGKKIYLTYCAVCHGEAGDGQGHLVQIEKFPAPPSYFTPDLMSKPEGQRYHTIMYGKGMMGSYATQINHRERWLVLEYIKGLQAEQLAKGGTN